MVHRTDKNHGREEVVTPADNQLIRVLIADDQVLFLEGLKYVLESRAPDIEVVATASDGIEACEMAAEFNPDVVLMDVRMPRMDGVQATRGIHEANPDVKILMLTTFDDDAYALDSIRGGAIGYLLKNRPVEELIMAIRAVMRGIMQIDPTISDALFHTEAASEENGPDLLDRLETLTKREREVLMHLIRAFDNKQIAENLFVAEQTVRNHVSVIYSKLCIENRMQVFQHIETIKAFFRTRDP